MRDSGMQITIEDISPVEKRVDFELPWADVAPRLDKAYNQLRREVHIRGFRPGKAPRSVLERLYRARIEDDVARELIENALGHAIHENQIQPVAPPTVDKIELKSGTPFKFSAKVEVRSQVTPKDYTGIPLERRPPKVTDVEVADALEGYRRRQTEFVPIEGRTETAATDLLVVELHGEVGGHHVHRTDKEAVTVDLEDEAGGPLPGLAGRLRGIPIAASKHKIAYRIAADTPIKDLAGKDVALEVTIKDARQKKVPALDDELAKDTGEADTLEALRTRVRERLLEADKARAEREMRQRLVKALAERNPFPIAPALVERHAQAIVNRAKAQLMMMGIDVEGTDDAKMRADFKGDAEEEARGAILLQAIAEREGLQVGDADIQKRIAEIASARGENPKKLRAEYERDHRIAGVRLQLLEEKTLELLVSQARITDADPDRLIVTPDEARAEAAGKKKR